MRRYLPSAAVIFALALLVSVLAHLQAYGVLGKVSEWVSADARSRTRAPSQVELEFEPLAEDEPAPEVASNDVNVDVDIDDSPDPNAPAIPEVRPAPEPPVPQAAQQPLEPPRPELALPATPTPPPPQPTAPDRRQSITQRSEDPPAEAPPDARFLAEQNRRVEEETVASLRNYQRDDADPRATSRTRTNSENAGNDDEQDTADLRERDGSEQRAPTPREAEMERPRESATTLATNTEARGNSGQAGAERSPSTSRAEREGASAQREAASAAVETITIDDGNGSFTITVPRRREGRGAGGADGASVASSGNGRGRSGAGPGARSNDAREASGRGFLANGPDLRVSWSAFEQMTSPDELARQREAYVRERRSKARGSSRTENWQSFRAAIENFVPNVRPGQQSALNAAASPFAGYLSEVHRRVHREFVDRFIANMPGGSTNELNDPSLVTKLEIIINRDGTLHRLGIVNTSGYMPYDYGAFESVVRAQPFPEAPQSILSGDGRVYLHWALNRDERHCGTWNAEPYILPHPPDSPPMRLGPMRDAPPGGVIPRDSRPAGETGSLPRSPTATATEEPLAWRHED